ncbi:PqqD family protein [Nonomuraea sp. MG754425]|uniref:PqqD family peptide modification chaperone n=1 Tax=Nonomuraea sp. MG754425 TaxID=2570319 RepID=UPI001F46EA21|nr:PqqD family peptide modification chaperone [Nonomuraea sp. MG754425]MCF6473780.1 PqqD family protein [Nonomuraea sp. MG754425]
MTVRLRPYLTLTPVETPHGCEAAVLDERTGRYHRLNATGLIIVRALLDGHDTAEAARRLVAAHSGAAPNADAADAAFVTALRDAGLLTDAEPGGSR